MSISRKYGRTFHFPFSPGTTSDDRINNNYFDDIKNIKRLVITEKLDGENTCINSIGVFSRSHAVPTRNPWSNYLKEKRDLILKDIESENIEIFGENLYAVHSIEYQNLENHFYVFGIRKGNQWLPWNEVEDYCYLLDLKTVPVLDIIEIDDFKDEKEFENHILSFVSKSSTFGSKDIHTGESCSMEGIVAFNYDGYETDESGHISKSNVFKYVRKGHVKTDQHWSRNWKVAKLINW